MSKPDYAKWMRKELWTLIEAAYLLSDLEPVLTEQGVARCLNAEKPDSVFDIYNDLKNGRINRSLKIVDRGDGGWVGYQRVDPSHCIEWAVNRGMAVPLRFRQIASTVAADSQKASERAEVVYLRVIGALLKVLLGKQRNGRPNSFCTSQDNIIHAIREMCPDERGFAPRTLQDVFARANQALKPK
jgi:hypothetical protein